MNIFAKIENVEYEPLLCRELPVVSLKDFEMGEAFTNANFVVDIKEGKIAISHWVSAKRTRSYPFARVYDTMNYKTRITIIPLVKDEGKDGDRDYLQWDTVSLMSLLGVYVIIAYYDKANKSKDYDNKITDQEFDYKYVKKKFKDDQLDAPIKFKTIERKNSGGERVYVKSVPGETLPVPISVANLLDCPNNVAWQIKESHREIINPNNTKINYALASAAGSMCLDSPSQFTFLKEPNTQVNIFPLDPLNKNNPVTNCEVFGNMAVGSYFTVTIMRREFSGT